MTVFIGVGVSDFELSLTQGAKMAFRGEKGMIRVNIIRSGGFNGNVTVSSPDTRLFKIKMSPAEHSTTGTSVEFAYKIKPNAPMGMQRLTFVGKDDSGRTREATLIFLIGIEWSPSD